MRPKKNWQQNTVCLEQQIYASREHFTQPLVVMVETFWRSAAYCTLHTAHCKLNITHCTFLVAHYTLDAAHILQNTAKTWEQWRDGRPFCPQPAGSEDRDSLQGRTLGKSLLYEDNLQDRTFWVSLPKYCRRGSGEVSPGYQLVQGPAATYGPYVSQTSCHVWPVCQSVQLQCLACTSASTAVTGVGLLLPLVCSPCTKPWQAYC